MNRQYNDQQLADIARPYEEHALDALHAGDRDRVRELLSDMAQGHAGLDALTVHALARKAGKLRQDLGENRALEVLQTVGAELMKTWVWQYRDGDVRGAIADLVSIYKFQGDAWLEPLRETDDEVILELAPCGSGGRLERQGFPERHPDWYGNWSDGVSSMCQACKACQHALNDTLGEEVWSTEKGADGQCTMRFAKTGYQGKPLFDEVERERLVRTRVQQVEHKLDAGEWDVDLLLRGQRKDWMPWHDFAVVWLEYFYAAALELGGADYLDSMLAQTYEQAFHAGFPRYAGMNDDELVREVARTWNYHCADFSISEEDDRFVFRLDPCGSGGRLLRGDMWRDMFRYGDPMSPMMNEPHNINFNRDRAPAYCTHCAVSNRAQLEDGPNGDRPRFFVIDGHAQMRPGQACRQFSYKKAASRQNMDPALLAQVGIKPWSREPDENLIATSSD